MEQRDGGARDANVQPDARPSVPDVKPSGDAGGSGDARLDALAGRYLIRFDTFGTATSGAGTFAEIQIRSRLSLLIAAELTVTGDKLKGTERICNQVAEQRCLKGCTDATTVVDPRAVSGFLLQRTYSRDYTVDGGSFTAERLAAAIGYDDDDDDSIPSSSSDPRVWDVISGGTREGLLTRLTVQVPILAPITCDVYGTQRFVSTFGGKLTGTGAASAFPKDVLELLEAETSGGSRLGSDNEMCAMQEATSDLDKATARMLPYGDELSAEEFWGCPTDAKFEQLLPGGPLD